MSNMAAPTAETEVVSGTVIGIIQKGQDKWQVAVQPPDSQYSRNLWTKDAELVSQLATMIGSQQSFMCGISHWTNQQNQPVRSLWINGVGPGIMQAQPQAQPQVMQTIGQQIPPQYLPQQQPQGQPQPQMPVQQPQPQVMQQQPVAQPPHDARQDMIHRQTAAKVAVHLMVYLPSEVERSYDTFLTLCERLVHYFDHGMPASTPPPAQDDGHSYNEFPPGY